VEPQGPGPASMSVDNYVEIEITVDVEELDVIDVDAHDRIGDRIDGLGEHPSAIIDVQPTEGRTADDIAIGREDVEIAVTVDVAHARGPTLGVIIREPNVGFIDELPGSVIDEQHVRIAGA